MGYRLTVSNGLSIDTCDYSTKEEAVKAMADSYAGMGEGCDEDASYLGEMSAFHQGQDECNVFDISEIPGDVRSMPAEQILAAVSEEVRQEMANLLLKGEFCEDVSEIDR